MFFYILHFGECIVLFVFWGANAALVHFVCIVSLGYFR